MCLQTFVHICYILILCHIYVDSICILSLCIYLFVSLCPSLSLSAGLSNIIGIIVYISANSGDPGQSDSKKSYSYGWSFYFGALSFIMAETVGVLAVHMFIEKHRKQQRAKTLVKKSSLGFGRIPTYRYRFGRRSSETPSRDVPMFTLSRDTDKTAAGKLLDSDRDFLHNSNAKDAANRRTTPVWHGWMEKKDQGSGVKTHSTPQKDRKVSAG